MTETAIEYSVQVAKEIIYGFVRSCQEQRPPNQVATLYQFLLRMPREWREGRSCLEPYPAKLVETAFAAILELAKEGKVKLVPVFISEGALVTVLTQSGSVTREIRGHWEFGVALNQSQNENPLDRFQFVDEKHP